jgi:hypothetical protein
MPEDRTIREENWKKNEEGVEEKEGEWKEAE